MSSLPIEGFRDLSRRIRIIRLLVGRWRIERSLAEAETQLGWLGWEQVDFFDNEINAEVEKIRIYENTQADLLNTSAELSGNKAVLDEELTKAREAHDKTLGALTAERAQIAAQLEQAETRRSQRLGAIERFQGALDELDRLESEVESQSVRGVDVTSADIRARVYARETANELARIASERKLVIADKSAAADEVARLDASIERLQAEIVRINSAADSARERLADVSRRHDSQVRQVDRKRQLSDLRMNKLDKDKRSPYRLIGACLADHGIAPLNQPEILEKVFNLRETGAQMTQTISDLEAASAAVPSSQLFLFYLFLAAILLVLLLVAAHFLHH